MKELYNSLDPIQADSLTGPAGAARLKAAGYTAAAVQLGAEGKITMWDMKLAGYSSPANSSSSSAPVAHAGPSRTPRLGWPGSSRSSHHGAIVAGAAGVQGRDAAATATCADSSDAVNLQAAGQPQASAVLKADGPWDVDYFRHQIKPLMHMQPGTDIPDLMMGTKVGLRLLLLAMTHVWMFKLLTT